MSQVAIVTGATSGIGAAIAVKLVADGYRVFNFDLRAPEQDAPGVTTIACDVSDEAAVEAANMKVKELAGPANVLVNNCGLQFMAPFYYFKNSWGTSSFGVDAEIDGVSRPGYGTITQQYAHDYASFYQLTL